MPAADGRLRYYAYVSRAKVSHLYEQLHREEVVRRVHQRGNEVKGDLGAGVAALFSMVKGNISLGARRRSNLEEETNKTTIQKLRDVLEHIEDREKVESLNKICEEQARTPLNSFAYTYSGRFKVKGSIDRGSGKITRSNRDQRDPAKGADAALATAALEENSFREIGRNNGSLVSSICLLQSRCGGFMIELACSLKYFSDMGGSWSEGTKEWYVCPHSGNYHFFTGNYETFFEGLIFITGVKGKKILGSPLFLMMPNDPNLMI